MSIFDSDFQTEDTNGRLDAEHLAHELTALLTAHLFYINLGVSYHLENNDIIEEEEKFDEICLARKAGTMK